VETVGGVSAKTGAGAAITGANPIVKAKRVNPIFRIMAISFGKPIRKARRLRISLPRL
jgi:pyruvate formate-lyase activating enzyme-like uncharacterized protein